MLVIETIRDGNIYTLALAGICLPFLGGDSVIKVNGEVVTVDHRYGPFTITVSGLPHVELFRETVVKVSYRSQQAGVADMDVDEWEEWNARLLAKSVGDPHCAQSWADVEYEILWMRHNRSFRLETRRELVKDHDILLSVSDKVPEQPFMTPQRLLGGDYMSSLVVYARAAFLVDRIKSLMASKGIPEEQGINLLPRPGYRLFENRGEISLHLPGGFHRKFIARTITDTYAIAMSVRDKDAAMVDGWIAEWSVNIARPVNALEVGEKLRSILSQVLRLQVKTNGIADRSAVIRDINLLLAKVVTEDKQPASKEETKHAGV